MKSSPRHTNRTNKIARRIGVDITGEKVDSSTTTNNTAMKNGIVAGRNEALLDQKFELNGMVHSQAKISGSQSASHRVKDGCGKAYLIPWAAIVQDSCLFGRSIGREHDNASLTIQRLQSIRANG